MTEMLRLASWITGPETVGFRFALCVGCIQNRDAKQTGGVISFPSSRCRNSEARDDRGKSEQIKTAANLYRKSELKPICNWKV